MSRYILINKKNFQYKGGQKMKGGPKKLLQDERVREEIDKHKWLESEKAGYDIGFEKAAEDWISRYADEWEQTNSKRENKRYKRSKPRGKDYSE